MKKIILSSLLLGSFVATGCVVESNTDDNTDDVFAQPGVITASIALSSAGAGAIGACQPGDAIRINTRDTANNNTSDLFNCDDTSVTTAQLAPGSYTLWVDYVNDNGTAGDPADDKVVGTTSSTTVVVDGNQSLSVDLVLDHGFIVAGWTIFEGGTEVPCRPSEGVSLLATLSGTADATDDIFNCSDAAGFTDPLILGEYIVDMTLLDADDAVIGEARLGAITTSIDDGNDYADLGDVIIDII